MTFGFCLVNRMFFAYLWKRRMSDQFKGDMRVYERRRECLDLADWIDGMKADGDLPSLEKCKTLFAKAMARIDERQGDPSEAEPRTAL